MIVPLIVSILTLYYIAVLFHNLGSNEDDDKKTEEELAEEVTWWLLGPIAAIFILNVFNFIYCFIVLL